MGDPNETAAGSFWAALRAGDGRPVCLVYLRAGCGRAGVGLSELPSGTVTFLFTDIEGSTRLWEEHPDAMRDALARHDELLRDGDRGARRLCGEDHG